MEDLTPETIRRARAGYFGLVTEMDRNVGRILDALASSTFGQDTCVIYTTDHGEMAGENGMWWKYNFYEGSVAVPLIISHPGRLPQGKKVDAAVGLVDLGATLCEMAGTEAMSTSSGKSLMPLLETLEADGPREVLSELPAIGPVPATRMIRRGAWKLVNFDGMRPQLFNLEKDPQEFQDLGEDSAFAQIRDELLLKSRVNWWPEESRKTLEDRARSQAMIAKWAEVAHSEAPSARREGLLWRSY